MQKDYQAEAQKMQQQQQQQYQKSRDPFKFGQDVAKRRYSEIMSGIDNQRNVTNQAYGDLFQKFKQQSVKDDAMAGQTLSGGMGQQQKDYTSAIEMQQGNQIAKDRLAANNDLFTQAQSAFSNAQLEGQQATQMQLQNEQVELQRVQQKQAIVNSDMSAEEKAAQLNAMGVDVKAEDLKAANTGLIGGWQKLLKGEASASQAVGTILSTAAIVAGGYLAIAKGPAVYKFVKNLFNKKPPLPPVATGGAAASGAAKASSTKNIVQQLLLPAPKPQLALPAPAFPAQVGGNIGQFGNGSPGLFSMFSTPNQGLFDPQSFGLFRSAADTGLSNPISVFGDYSRFIPGFN